MRSTVFLSVLVALLVAGAAFAAQHPPIATPFNDAFTAAPRLHTPVTLQHAVKPLRSLAAPANVFAAALAVGTRLVDLQSDVTEDNAGNGSPDSPADSNDGGWDWGPIPAGPAHHTGNGSYENLYGPLARGLVAAAIATGDARMAIGAHDVFAGISRPGKGLLGTEYYRIWNGDLATAYIRWADWTGNPALKDTIKARHDIELARRGGAGGRALTVRNGRVGQGLNGMWPWDIHLLTNDCTALAAAFPGSAATYGAEVDAVSQVLQDDRNDLLGLNGWDPADFSQNYHQIGVAGALRVFDDSPRTDDNALATAMRDTLVNGQLEDGSWGVSYYGTFYGQDAQATSYAVLALTAYGARHGDAAAMQAAERGKVWMLSQLEADGSLYPGQEYPEVNGELLGALLSGDPIAAQSPGTCISTAYSCVAVPVTFTRADATPVRGFSVTLTLSPNLALCGVDLLHQIVEGDYLKGLAPRNTQYQLVDNGGGSYTVDCAILGGGDAGCGPTGSGTLFTLNLGSSAAGGTGTVTINSVSVRDCTNADVSAAPGPALAITIDNTAPTAVTLTAVQQRTANLPADGTTTINLSWAATEAGSRVEIYRKGFGHYPDYDEPGGAVPTAPPTYPPSGWAPAGTVTAPAATFADDVATRDFYYYVAYVIDACGNVSAVSNRTGGTLNYHLGDVAGSGDNQVATVDVSLLGMHYGVTIPVGDPLEVLDVGPTTNHSVNARPTTDHKTNFEDLMMFSINYSVVSKPSFTPAAAAADQLALEVSGSETVSARLRFAGTGLVQGISAGLAWNPAVVTPVGHEAGELLGQQNGVAFSAAPGTVDAVVLGTGRGLWGEGTLAVIRFRRIGEGDPGIALASVDARDTQNRRVDLAASVPPVKPVVAGLRPVNPNPFRGSATLEFGLAAAGGAELSLYSVDGRLVRTLVSGACGAGTHRATWNGRDDHGGEVAPGIYFARLRTAAGTFSRSVVLLK